MRLVSITGLGFGDEGKGAITHAVAREFLGPLPLVVRHNGGGQAAHNVHLPDDAKTHHTFSQLGSGSFVGCGTHLSSDFLFNPVTFLKELAEWGYPKVYVSIDPTAKVVTPYHMAANAAREDARGDARHGSCAQGIGELMADSMNSHCWSSVMRAGILRDRRIVYRYLTLWRDRKAFDIESLGQPVPDWFYEPGSIDAYVHDFLHAGNVLEFRPDAKVLADTSNIIFEGAQGVLLDEDYGFHPHTTWSRTTPANAVRMIREHRSQDRITKIGVTRTYMTRHGAGPFVTEDPEIDFYEADNETGEYQGAFRKGHFDFVALKYAILVSGVNQLAVTHLDRLLGDYTKVCVGYRMPNGRVMKDIPVLPPDDFAARERLTAMLFEATPVWDWWPSRAFAQRLQLETGLDIVFAGHGLTSHGPLNSEMRIMSGQDGFDPYGSSPFYRSAREQVSQ